MLGFISEYGPLTAGQEWMRRSGHHVERSAELPPSLCPRHLEMLSWKWVRRHATGIVISETGIRNGYLRVAGTLSDFLLHCEQRTHTRMLVTVLFGFSATIIVSQIQVYFIKSPSFGILAT